MSVTYDSLLGVPASTIQYVTGAPNTDLYPDSNTVAIIGPLWAPRIYGRDLTALELASSGKIAFSLNDGYALDLSRSNYVNASNFRTSFVSQSNASFELTANQGRLQFLMDAYSNDVRLVAESNVVVQAVSAGMRLSASNDFVVSGCNDALIVAQSNVRVYASAGSLALQAQNSNVSMTFDGTTKDALLYSSNSTSLSACNALTTTANSNLVLTSVGASVLATANGSNVRLTLDAPTNSIVAFASNDVLFTACNSTTWSAKSNVATSANAGSWRAYADASNMLLTMERATDTATLYSVSNLLLSSSNDARLSATSNIAVRTVGGDLAVSANASNMWLTMAAATNDVSMYASNNLNVSISNAAALRTRLSQTQSTGAGGDYLLYVNDSNMFLRMSAITNNTYLYGSNDTFVSASNSLSLTARTDASLAASNGSLSMSAAQSNVTVTLDAVANSIRAAASNNVEILATSNVQQHALNGSARLYADLSNMGLTMERATDAVSLFTVSNLSLSASNDMALQAKSNLAVTTVSGSIAATAFSNVAIVASNSIVANASNSVAVVARSNVGVFAAVGSLSLAANQSNTYVTMNAATNDIAVYASNNWTATIRSNIAFSADTGSATFYASNDLRAWSSNNVAIQSYNDAAVATTQGSLRLNANASNMYVSMIAPTNSIAAYASNDLDVTACNRIAVTSRSNTTVSAVAGDLRIQANGTSNLFIAMDRATNNATWFASNNVYVNASNDLVARGNSNVLIQATFGSWSAIAASSNASLVMDSVALTSTLYASNDVVLSACNDLREFARSNVTVYANRGSIALAANTSNVRLNLDQPTNNLVAFASNDAVFTACNDWTATARRNVAWSAASSNVTFRMDATTRDFVVFSSNDFAISACNDASLRSQSNVSVAALAGSWSASADQSNLLLRLDRTTDDATLYASSNVWIHASNDLRFRAKSNASVDAGAGSVQLYANDSNLFVTLDRASSHATLFAISNVRVWASNDFSVVAKSNVAVTAQVGSFDVSANASNMYLSMTQATNAITVYASNDISVTASNSTAWIAQSNAAWSARTGTMTVYASNDYSLTTSNNHVSTAKSNVTISADAGSVLVAARASNMFVRMDQPTNTMTLSASNDVVVTACNNLSAQAQSNVSFVAAGANFSAYANANLQLAADSSNMRLQMLVPSDLIDLYTVSNVQIRSSNVVSIAATSNFTVASSNVNVMSYRDMFLTASNNITISASNTLSLNFGTLNTTTSNDQAFTAQSNVSFFISAASNAAEPIFVVRNDQILVRGDIVVTGSINTSNVMSTTVMQESLKIMDKELTVASSGSNFNPIDGPFDGPATNSGAGIRIDGVPATFDSNIPEAYDKTLTWNNGSSGIAGLGTLAGLSNEAYWEFKGGSLRLTHQRIVPSGGSNIIRNTTFGFRINDVDELEFMKSFWYSPSNAYVTRRVARFGRIL